MLALHRTESAEPSTTAVDYLAGQACDDGGFPQQLREPGDDAAECHSEVDATGFAVQALLAAGDDAPTEDAVAWLLEQQDGDGGFVGEEGTINANSTGLAALALVAAGQDVAADDARDLLRTLQFGCDEAEPGAIRYDDTDEPGVELARATSQALPALTSTPLAGVDAAQAETDDALLACPAPDEADDGPADDLEDAG